MILRRLHLNADGSGPVTGFEAIEERSGAFIASCLIQRFDMPELFPQRPVRLCWKP